MKTIMEKSAACCVVLAVLSTTVLYGAAKMDPPASQADAAKAQLLFVQTAQGLACTNNTIVLKGVNPITIYFSDRPERIAGHLTTAEFVPTWGEGQDSFKADPPNASLAILDSSKVADAVLTLANPRLMGADLAYDVKVLEGALPATGGACSLFIDFRGFARGVGVRRPVVRGVRPVYYGGPAVVYDNNDDDNDDGDDDDDNADDNHQDNNDNDFDLDDTAYDQ